MRNDILNKKNEILQWINENRSKAYICRELKCKPITLELYLQKMNICYGGNQGNRGYGIPPNKKTALSYCYNGSLITSYKLKNKLLEEQIKLSSCEKCQNTVWNGQIIPLELHHKDGNRFNNELNNLMLLCPNCHAQEANNCKPKNKKDYGT